MKPNILIDSTVAKDLLTVLALENEAGPKEIEWALKIIRQIPGYEKISLAKAVQDVHLKEILAAIAREEIAPTTPKNIKILIEEAVARKKAQQEAEAAGKKQTENLIKAAQKWASEKAPEKTQPAAVESPSLPEEGSGLGLKITPETGRVIQKIANRAITAPFRAAISFGAPILKVEEPTRAAALSLLAHGVRSDHLESQISQLDAKQQQKIQTLIKAVKNEESFFPIQTKLLKKAFPVKEITFLLGPASGLTQAQVAIFLRTEEPGRVEVVSRRSLVGDILNRVGQQLFGKVSKNFLKRGAEKGAGKLAKKAVAKAATEAVTTTAATATGPPGWLVKVLVWLGSEILPRIQRWIKEHFKEILAAGLVGIGVIIGGGAGAALMIGGGLVWLAGAGVTTIANSFGAFVSFFVSGLLAPALGGPLLAILVGLPLVILLILFIINSGAFVVPPADFSALGENPYVGVVKEVSPTGPFENLSLPVTVTYTITITAKKGVLTNIRFEHKCEIVAANTTSPCPAPLPNVIPNEISPSEPYVFSYVQTYGGSLYQNSLVINTFTVAADSQEQPNASASTVASIIIGNPPVGCYNVSGNWPPRERSVILAAISWLVGERRPFVARLCAAYRQVNLYYDPARVCGAWGCAPGGNNIYFNSGGLGNITNATYILAHESGHVLAYGSPSLYQAYLVFPGTIGELPVCTYGGSEPAEGFAEAIARYAIGSACLSNEPNNKKFAETYIFR